MNKEEKNLSFKVLMIAPTPYFSDRGCHVRIYEEAKALIAKGHNVEICTYHLGRNIAGIPTHRIPTVPWYKKKSAGPSWHKLYLDLLLLYTTLKVSRQFKPDVIHAHLHEGAFIGFFVKWFSGVPMIFDCQGSLTGEVLDHGFMREGSLLEKMFAFVENQINKGADWIITSSNPTAELLVEKFHLSANRVLNVGDGVDTERFKPGLKSTNHRNKLKLPEDKKIVVFLGAMTEYQGVNLLIDAIKQIVQTNNTLHFLLMGYPEEKYVDMAEDAGISSAVTFTGRIDYALAPEFLCLGDLAVSPKLSATEANGKLFNYMASGLPTVVFDNPVNREILGDLGVYARTGDASDLAKQIIRLASDEEMLIRLRELLRKRAVDTYSWNRIADNIVNTYQYAQNLAGKRNEC